MVYPSFDFPSNNVIIEFILGLKCSCAIMIWIILDFHEIKIANANAYHKGAHFYESWLNNDVYPLHYFFWYYQ